MCMGTHTQQDQNLRGHLVFFNKKNDLEHEESRSQSVPLLLWALCASELISAERVVGTRWRMLDVSYFYTSHRGCYPHGIPLHTPYCLSVSGSCCVKTMRIKTKCLITSDLQYRSIWCTRLWPEGKNCFRLPVFICCGSSVLSVCSPENHLVVLSGSLSPLYGNFAMNICPDIYWLWADDLLEICLRAGQKIQM